MAKISDFPPNLFGSELAEMKILLCNWHMAIKTYYINSFHLLLKNLTSQSKCLEKRRFCEFIQKATNGIFSFLHFYEGYIPSYQYRIVSNLGILGWNFSHFGPPWDKKDTSYYVHWYFTHLHPLIWIFKRFNVQSDCWQNSSHKVCFSCNFAKMYGFKVERFQAHTVSMY